MARAAAVPVFFALAFAVTWAVWLPRALGAGWADSVGTAWSYGPAIAAVLTAALLEGGAGLRDLGARLVRWRVGWRWWAVALLGPPAFWAVAVALAAALGWSDRVDQPPMVEQSPLALVPLLLLLVLTDGVGEEAGWRGYALPRLLTRMGPAAASLLLGLLWAAWHLPLFWTPGAPLEGSSPWLLLLALPAVSVVYTWLFRHTGGSALVAVVFHAVSNLCTMPAGLAGGGHAGVAAVVLGLQWAGAAAVLVAWRRAGATGPARDPAVAPAP
jgi:membrane protease YdiL (CAAX protease family)